MIKKTATITWLKYNNYGTLLQSYALQKVITKMGYENRILDDSWFIEPYQRTIRYRFSTLCHKILSKIFNKVGIDFFNVINPITHSCCRNFVKNYLDVDYDVNDLGRVSERYDCFICGSDQIWNPGPEWYDSLNTSFYYAGFTKKKRIAYAPSLGVSHYPEKHKKELISYICDFSALSSRETEGCKIMSSLLGRDVPKVMDPTLLLSEDDWREIIGKKRSRKGYALCYFLSPQQWYWDFVGKQTNKNNCKVLCFDVGKKAHNDIIIVHGGPKEFLEYIDGADVVFTDSFHATIFSSILRTNFYTLERFSKTSLSYPQNLRLNNFFSMIGVNDRYVTQSNFDCFGEPCPLDFELIKKNILRCADNSYNYLRNALYDGNM